MPEFIATICVCSSRSIIDKDKVTEVAKALSHAGYKVNIEPDLCKKAITSVADMSAIATSTVIACYPRAINSLFDSLGLKPQQALDIRNCSVDEILNKLNIQKSTQEFTIDNVGKYAEPEAWYPVIDKDRCSECGKCHDFCLFGVYSIIGGKIKVQQPQNCKINCPACARVCPEKAIIFPKYEKSPINGGLVDEEEMGNIDTKELYNHALRLKLAERKAGITLLKKDK